MIIIQVYEFGRSKNILASVAGEDASGLTGHTILKLDHLTKKNSYLIHKTVVFDVLFIIIYSLTCNYSTRYILKHSEDNL